MSRITVTGTVEAPRKVVWEFLTDFGRIPEYSSAVDEVEDRSPDPVEAGPAYREVGGWGPVTTEMEWEVARARDPHQLILHGDAPVGDVTVAYYLDAADGRTRLRQVTVYEFLPAAGVLADVVDWALFHRLVGRHMVETVGKFAALVEREYGTEVPIE